MDAGPLINLRRAAEYLGLTPSGLRKLVAKREVRYFQRKRHSPIMFKREWLDEYVAKHTFVPKDEMPPAKRTNRRRISRQPAIDDRQDDPHGFRRAMLKL